MYFRLRKDAKSWFGRLLDNSDVFETQFDIYYYLAVAGMSAGKRSVPPGGWASTGDLVDNFPSAFKASRSLVIGLLICSELSRLGVDVAEKKEVQEKLNALIDPESPSKLTDHGVTALNEYASGGYEYLVQQLGAKPDYPEEFLLTFLDEIDGAVKESDRW